MRKPGKNQDGCFLSSKKTSRENIDSGKADEDPKVSTISKLFIRNPKEEQVIIYTKLPKKEKYGVNNDY